MIITLTLQIVFMRSQNINMHNYSPIFCNIEISSPSIFINSNNSFISLNSFFAVFCRSFSVWTAQLFAWNFERWSVRYSHTYRLWFCYTINKHCIFQLLLKLLNIYYPPNWWSMAKKYSYICKYSHNWYMNVVKIISIICNEIITIIYQGKTLLLGRRVGF